MARKKDTKVNDGSYIFSDFSKGLYLLDTPRGMGEQLASLAITGGRNVWAEKGALVPQYGYEVKAELPEEEYITGITKATSGNNNFFITSITGKVYFYTASQGLKLYKTELPVSTSEPILTRRNKDLIEYLDGTTYMFGAYYEDSEKVTLEEAKDILNFTTYFQFTVSMDNAQYYWNDKEICFSYINSDEEEIDVNMVISSCYVARGDTVLTVKAYCKNQADADDIPATVDISEKTKFPVTLIYEPDNTGVEPPLDSVTLLPTLMEVSNNRLYVVHVTGDIYYSEIGVLNEFKEAYGAGFFGGFYADTSQTLAIEDYLTGVLITKQNGIYYMELGDSLTIKKITQVGQEYATDHIIVQDKVYAYDKNSGAIVNAVSVNVFGNMVSGKPIISSEYLNAQDMGIDSTRRVLTYNAESEVFILYYGENLNKGIILTKLGTLFPRELDKDVVDYIGFNQGVMGITDDNKLIQDFKKGTTIPQLSAIAEFEAIGVRDNRFTVSTLLEVTELNGIEYDLTTTNAGSSYQHIRPVFNTGANNLYLPPLIYSDEMNKYNSFELTSKWAEKSSNLTRVYAPMSGRAGVGLTLEFPANVAFCLSALRLPDFSQGY